MLASEADLGLLLQHPRWSSPRSTSGLGMDHFLIDVGVVEILDKSE